MLWFLRKIKPIVEAALVNLSSLFDQMYADTGRPSIPPEHLLKGCLLIALFSVRGERQFCERLQYDLLFKWFLDLNILDAAFDHSVFSKNKDRLLEHQVAREFSGNISELIEVPGMTAAKMRDEIHNFLGLLQSNDIALYTNSVRVESLPGVKRVTWASSSSRPFRPLDQQFATLAEYSHWRANNEYSAFLFDGAFFQISYEFQGDTVIKHRLLYYPCPFEIDRQLLKDEPILDVLDMYRMDSRAEEYLRLRTPVRFDYDLTTKSASHPASHLTLNVSNCRWPVVAPLSLGHFVRFIFMQFYPETWKRYGFLRSWQQTQNERSITEVEQRMLHIGCAQ